MFKRIFQVVTIFCIASASVASASNRTITIIRHGQGDHNIEHFYSSNPSHPNYRTANLTKLGKEQATYAGKKLKVQGFNKNNIAKVIVSPLPRTIQTANLMAAQDLFDKSHIEIDPRVIEMQAGHLEGQHFDPETLDWDNPTPGVKDAETKKELRCRMQNFYNDIISKYPEGHILVVTHGSPSMQLIHLLTNEDLRLGTADVISIPISNAKLSVEKC